MNELLERLVIALESIAAKLVADNEPVNPLFESVDRYQMLVDAGEIELLRVLSKERGIAYNAKTSADTLAENLRKYDLRFMSWKGMRF